MIAYGGYILFMKHNAKILEWLDNKTVRFSKSRCGEKLDVIIPTTAQFPLMNFSNQVGLIVYVSDPIRLSLKTIQVII